MVRKIVLMLLAAGALGAAELESRIVRVTVYPGAALVEREADLNLKAGANTFTLAGLPAVLVDESVHARLISGRGLAIEEIKVERWFLSRADQGEARKVETAILDLERQIMLLKDFGVTVMCCTPSYFVHMIEAAAEMGVSLHDLPLRTGIFGAEPWTESIRQVMQREAGIQAYDIYGLS